MKQILFISIIFLTNSVFSATRYWVGGTGTWDNSTTTNWASSSGGGGGASYPTSSDDVIFDANSFSAGSQTVTLGAYVSFKTLNFSAVTNNPTLNGNFNDLQAYGNVTFSSSMTLNCTWTALNFKASGTLNTNGLSVAFYYIQASTGATLTLGSNLTCTSGYFYITSATGVISLSSYTVSIPYISMSNGTLNMNTSTLTTSSVSTISGGTLNMNTSTPSLAGLVVSGGTFNCGTTTFTSTYLNVTSGTIVFSSGNINLTGSSNYELSLASGCTVTTGTPTISFTGANNTGTSPIEIYLGTKTIYDISITTGTYSVNLFDGGTIHNVTLPSTSWLNFESSKTFTFTGIITPSTTCQSYTLFSSSTPGTAATISLSASQTAMSYMQIKDITNSGTNTTCTSCVNTGTNSGFTFSSPYAARTLYWMGTATGTGNWGTGSNWTTNSNGTSSGNTCVPTIVDAVIFDANSFDAASKTLTIDQRATAASINFTGTANSPAITNSSGYDILVTGDLTLTSGIGTITNSGSVYFIGTSSQKITCGGKRLSSGTTYFSNPSTIYSEDDGYYGTIYIKNGTLDVQNNAGSTVNNLYFSGDWYSYATFQPRSNSSKYTIFNGTSNGTIYTSTTFYNLKVDNSSSALLITGANVIISNELLITGGYYENTNSKTTTVSGSVNITSTTATGYLYVDTGTFSYLNNSTTNFNLAKGYIWAWGGTINIGSSGTHTTTVMNIGDATGSSGEAYLEAWGSTINIVDRLVTNSDGVLDVMSSTINIKTNTTDGGTAGTSKWQMNSSGQFKMSSGTINVLGAADNNTTNAISFNTGSTFTAGNITGGTVVLQSTTGSYDYPVDFGGKTLYHLTVNQSSRTFKMVSNSLTLKGNLTITAGTLDANAQNITLKGNWTNNSTYANTGSANLVTFNGSSAQAINGSSSTTFSSATINNSSTGVTIGINTTVKNTLTMTAGKLITQGYTLTVGTSSVNGAISGGSSTSYIVAYDNSGTIGYIKQFVNSNSTYNFPLGDNSNYTPLTWTLNTNGGLSSAYLTVYTIAAYPTGMATTLTEYINRSWDVTSSGMTTPNYDISYVYATGDIVSSEANLMPFKITGGTVYKPTNSSFTVYNVAQGSGSVNTSTNTLTWTGLSTFSLFGGAGNAATALPITLVNFDAKPYNKNILVYWQTASEINNDFFTVERSLDGENFRNINIVKGFGNSSHTINYSIVDEDVKTGIYYYRLIQTDFNGNSTLSPIVSVAIRALDRQIISTVNTLGQQVSSSYQGVVFDVYSDGTSVKRIQ